MTRARPSGPSKREPKAGPTVGRPRKTISAPHSAVEDHTTGAAPQPLRAGTVTTVESAPDGGEDRKSAQTRRRILDAAAHVLSVAGYGGLRLTDVAAYADLQAPAIYYYFPSRDKLIEEVMWFGLANLREHVTAQLEGLPAETSPRDRLLAAAEAHLRHALEISDYTTASIRNSGQVPAAIQARQLVEEERYGEVWRRLINALARSGELRADLDLYIAQMLVLGALNWTVEWWDPRRGSVDAVVANARSIISHGLADPRTPQVPPELTSLGETGR